MEKVTIKETNNTPFVNLDFKNGVFDLVGNSYSKNTLEFYQPIIELIEKYFDKKIHYKTVVNLELLCFDAASLRLYFYLFDLLEDENENENIIEINWFYRKDNHFTFYSGKDYQEEYENLNINLIEKFEG